MSSTDARPARDHEKIHFECVAPALLTLTCLLLGALMLAQIRVFDWSIFVHDATPRAELWGATLGALGFLAVGASMHQVENWRSAIAVALLAPLAASAFLALEATTLVLCPNSFELMPEWAFVAIPNWLGNERFAVTSTAVVTAGIAWALSTATFLEILATPERRQTRRILRSLVLASLVAGCLLVLFPVDGPALDQLPLPASMQGSSHTSAVAVPRSGFVCIPAAIVFLLIGTRWRHDATMGTPSRILRHVSLSLGALVVLFELFAGRYSIAAVLMSTLVAVAVLLADRFLEAGLDRCPNAFVDPPSASTNRKTVASVRSQQRVRFLLTIVFFFSGMAALVYQVVFAKGLALTFGSTSHASTIVLATYMGGLALGSWMGGHLAATLKRPVLGYAVAELGIAVICALSPLTLRVARAAYVRIAEGSNPSEPWLVGLQLALGAFVLVPPTWLMGLTLPLLTRQFLDDKHGLGASAGLLYTANTLGAAIGASVTGYLVLPALGIGNSLRLAVFTNVLVALFAVLSARIGRAPTSNGIPNSTPAPDELDSQTTRATQRIARPETTEVRSTSVAASTPRPAASDHARRVAWIATLQLAIGGFVTFGLETTFVHLLATVAGTSAYAFSLMLFAFLVGLSLGSSFGRKWLPAARHLPLALLLCQLLLAVTLLVACRFWDYLPAYFATFGRWPYTLTFASREFVRFVVCLVVMLPPAICIGAQFPIAMEAIGKGWPGARIQALGRASALNTVGNIAGALVIGFITLPMLGSHRTLALLALLCLSLAAPAVLLLEPRRRIIWGGLVATSVVALLIQPPNFDLTRLSSGGNVYFKPQYYGRIIDHAESLDGGLTAVALGFETSRTPVKTLLTNGKFQGNDRRDSSGEMMAQTSFAIAPLLHTTARNRSLVIGFGTGTTTRVLDESGFQQVAVAELSGDVVALADRHFSTINHGVIHRPNVKVHVTDGRNFLLLDRNTYDLISIELSSIWFAGAANLYNDEFYALVEPRLTDRGVLQQWVQLHRLSHRDVVSILATLHHRFPMIWLYFLGKQGILVACKSDCRPGPETVQLLRSTSRLETTLSVFNDGLLTVLQGRLLTPPGVDRLLEDYRKTSGESLTELLSTDDNLYLEYSTPKGNVREYDESIADNEAFLSRFRAIQPFEGTHLQPSALL